MARAVWLAWLAWSAVVRATVPPAIIIDLHGASGTGAMQLQSSKLYEQAVARGWWIHHPDGWYNTWNAGPGMYPPSSDWNIDHVTQITNIAKWWRTTYGIQRVFLSGFSNGCAMALRIGLEGNKENTFTAIACQSHSVNYFVTPTLPFRPIPMLLVYGNVDPFATCVSVHTTLERYRKNNLCNTPEGSIISSIGNVTDTSAVCRFENACPSWAPVEIAVYDGVGHMMPFEQTAQVIADFFARYVS
jgi:poly(3-hydroxybutyrate) depolymerase